MRERYLAAVGIDVEILHVVGSEIARTFHFEGEVEIAVAFVYLRNLFASEKYFYGVCKFRYAYAVACQHLVARNDFELWTFNLLLDVEVGYAFYIFNRFAHLTGNGIHAVEVCAEELDGNVCSCSGEHGIDAVGDR